MLTTCAARHDAFVKVHNADYLPNSSFKYLSNVGVKAVNIGPQMGASETRFIIEICDELGTPELKDRFLEQFYNSGKWEKWIDSKTRVSDMEKAILCGHYNYSTPEFKQTFSELSTMAENRGLSIRNLIVEHLKNAIRRIIN
jgi:hypothetical protein